MDELDCAQVYGQTSEQWFQIDREERALMIAHMQISRAMDALNTYDRSQEWKPPKKT